MTIIKTQLAMAACMMAAISVQAQENYRIPVSEEHEQMMTGQYKPHAAIHLLAHQRRL